MSGPQGWYIGTLADIMCSSIMYDYLTPKIAFSRAVEGHFDHPYGRPWMTIADQVTPLLAELVGAY